MPKTFYFGEGDTETPTDETEREQMELIDRFAESFLIQRKCAAVSSESALSSDTEDNLDLRTSAERERQEILMRLRPVLPRKQFEIPRFSPAAAWRLLSTEDEKREDTLDWLNNVEKIHIPEAGRNLDETEQNEERIEQIYREPGPALQNDNKSGDSGISGDAGLVERPESPRTRKPEAWTPQQDLGEDTSTDDDTEESIKRHMNSYQNKQVFSLTLPRDVHTPTYSEKSDKNIFNSMQKLKKDRSSAVEYDHSVPIISDDNWFLSRSIPGAASHLSMDHGSRVSLREEHQLPETTIKPFDSHETISYLTSGKHKVYLPNKENIACSMPAIANNFEDEIKVTKLLRKLPLSARGISPAKDREESPGPQDSKEDEPKV